ncbi:hypothetical protein EJB05_32602, partial [Eragrostis curvula]
PFHATPVPTSPNSAFASVGGAVLSPRDLAFPKQLPHLIDEEFIIHAAGLYRCHPTLRTNGKDLREACEQYVSGVSHLIKNDKLYADVMDKILTLGLEPDWDFAEKFQDEMVLKLKAADAAAAAAEDARNEVGYQMHHFMFATFLNLIENAVQFQKERSGRQKLQIAEKRSHSDLIES